MDALVRVMDGAGNTSLASLGYTHAGLSLSHNHALTH
eukprot:COSAG03_NODE_25737_length_264_cov_0.466667_2_plen_36_part_01